MYNQQNFGQGYGPQLPFSPTQLQHQFLNLSLNTPPFVPNLPVDQQLAQYVPLISAAAAIEVQQKAQANPLRTFMFNEIAANGFQNDVFATLILTIVEYVQLLLMKRQAQNIEMAIQMAVPQIVELVCSMNMRKYPDLEQFLQPGMEQTLRANIAFFDQLGQEINAMRNPQRGMYAQPMMGTPQPMYQPPMFQQPQQLPSAGRFNTPTNTVVQGNNPLFSNSGRPPAQVDNRQSSSGRYDKRAEVLAQPYAQRNNPPVAEATEPAQLVEPEEIPATPGAKNWKFNPAMPYFPVYNPATHEAFLRKDDSGYYRPVLKEKDNRNMDYDRHALPSSFGFAPKGFNLRAAKQTLAGIQEGIDVLNDKQNDMPVEEAKKHTAVSMRDNLWIETSEAQALASANLYRLMNVQENGEVPYVFRTIYLVVEPVVVTTVDTKVINNFGNSSTYLELREKLNAAAGDIPPGLWGNCHCKVTDMVNRRLSRNMSLPNLQISSFVEDIEDLIKLLRNKYSDDIADSFTKNQKADIAALFNVVNDDIALQMQADVFEGMEFNNVEQPKLIYFGSNYTVTLLNCLSYELEIDVGVKVGTAVTETFTPMLHNLLSQLFSEADDDVKIGRVYDRHLIATNDGRILEATKGYIGSDFMLLTLIK